MQSEKISVRCPECSKSGKIEIDSIKISKSPRGVTAINIERGFICDHALVVYVDRNGIVRDCYIADFIVSIPDIKLEKQINEKIIPDKELVDVYLLTINLNVQFLARVIRSCLLNQKILILNELNILDKHIQNFFTYMFQDSFKIDISLLNKHDYKKQKKNYKGHVIIDSDNIIQDKSRILKPKLLKLENKIVQKFMEEPDPKSSLIIIKNEIQKAFELSNSAYEYIKTLEKGETLDAEILNKSLQKKYLNIEIQSSYLNFIVEIIEKQNDIIVADAADPFSAI